ncbi:hypothetical protein IQ22_04441 [Pseudomonas duriflava]|uniref:Uncharacterized protein n=1 Tax=Pseudomonas duriflava TaxID=459528 RepID=A0A562PR35_9PSED|nr:hypothetical protein [Pseudomonas duriflava]TWI46869.1 hypothetical protein IQ22_04441 [Pseudomonas duriflava]
MTIAELIEVLSTFPPDHQVLVESADEGFDGIQMVRMISVGFIPLSPLPKVQTVLQDKWEFMLCNQESQAIPFDSAVVIEGLRIG